MEKVVLQSMTEFVLEQFELLKQYKISEQIFILRVSLFAKFLKQPLTLGMFVPVSVHGNILNEPVNYSAYEVGMSGKDFHFNFIDCQEYQEAKERVLFEGFELNGKHLWNKEKLFMISDNYNESFSNIKHIEWLLSNSMHEFVLTETAQKQIGLI